MKQPNGLMDYSAEGGPTDNCSPNMSVGRGPYRYTSLNWNNNNYDFAKHNALMTYLITKLFYREF